MKLYKSMGVIAALVGVSFMVMGCGGESTHADEGLDPLSKQMVFERPATQYGVQPLLMTDDVMLPANMDAAKSESGYTASTQATECSSCHMEEYLQWELGEGGDMYPVEVYSGGERYGAMHRLAYLDETFHHHYVENGSKDACLRCHTADTAYSAYRYLGTYAPASRPATSANVLEGVTCVTCHLDLDGNIVGKTAYESNGDTHSVLADPVMLGDGHTMCASCHNDPFWGALNSTYRQWEEQAKSSGLTCVNCHMVSLDDFASPSHAFPGAHSATAIDIAIDVTVPERINEEETFSIEACNVFAGHNLPSGDQFRAYVIKANVRNSNGEGFYGEKWISALFKTPIMVEIVEYDRIDPIAYGDCVDIPFERLDAGDYTVDFELGFWLVKPVRIDVKLPPWAEDTNADGEVYRIINTESIDLTVTN